MGPRRVETNNWGKYSLKEKNAEGKFYALAKQANTSAGSCLEAQSKTIKVGLEGHAAFGTERTSAAARVMP